MNRAHFLRSLVGAGAGLLVGNEALEAFERLTHRRRFFPGWSAPRTWTIQIRDDEVSKYLAEQARNAFYTFQEIDHPVPRVSDRLTPDVFADPRVRTYLDVRIARIEQEWCRSPRVTFST